MLKQDNVEEIGYTATSFLHLQYSFLPYQDVLATSINSNHNTIYLDKIYKHVKRKVIYKINLHKRPSRFCMLGFQMQMIKLMYYAIFI